MKRRSFLKKVGALAGACTFGMRSATAQEARGTRRGRRQNGPLPRRALGRTGEKLSIVGFPGLSLSHYEQPECNAGIVRAFERGVNYYDVAPAYGRNGECEIKMGIGLQAIPRDKIFLACKTKERTKDGARKELERSLTRLKTDHFDLYQMHCFYHPINDVEKAFGPDGAMETILKAKEEGKIRYIGFSAHTTKAAIAAMKTYKFDTVMFPINFVEYYNFGFGKEVCELAAEQGAGVLAIKTTSGGAWKKGEERPRKWWYRTLEERDEIRMALRFTLSQPQVVAGITPSFLDLLDRAIDVAQPDRPITKEELAKLEEMANTRGSVFLPEQQRAVREDAPHDCGYYAYA